MKFLITAVASTTPNHSDAVTGNSLVVGSVEGDDETRLYWQGVRQIGARQFGPMARSITHPSLKMRLADGEVVEIDGNAKPFQFRGETYHVLGGGMTVDYDPACDRPVF